MSKNKNEKRKIPFNVLRKGALTAMIGLTVLGGATMMSGCASGTPGQDGTIWRSGTSYTEFTNAKVGDFFIDTDDYILYQKTADSWTVVMTNYGRPGSTANDIEMQVSEGQIQWRYKTGVDTEWKNLLAVSTLTGANGYTPYIQDGCWYINGENKGPAVGDAGREVEIEVIDDVISWKYVDESETEWKDIATLTSLAGQDGKNIELQQSGEWIQWSIAGTNNWQNLYKVPTDGSDGREVVIEVVEGAISWKYAGESSWTEIVKTGELLGKNIKLREHEGKVQWVVEGTEDWQDLYDVPQDAREIEIQKGENAIQWRYKGDSEWVDLVDLSLLKGKDGSNGTNGTNGTDGKSVKIAVNGGNIQWRYTDDSNEWQTIISTETLKGADGTNGTNGTTPHIDGETGNWFIGTTDTGYKAAGINGKQIKLQVTADFIQWQYEGDETWKNLIPLSSLKGADGKDGATWLSGTDVPTTEGNNGDFYLNEANYDIYKKTDGSWVKIGNIKGSDGMDGVGAEISLPSYWKTYLDEKIAEINAKGESLGGDADSFIFITDQHLDGTTDYSAQIINYITKNTSIKKVIFGGDTLADNVAGNELLREYRESFSNDLSVFGMRGNHDPKANTTEKSFYDIMIRPLIDKADVSNELYYCYDNNAQKIRYIITDSVASKSNDLTSDKQLKWMQDKILELESDWTTIIFHHGIWEGTTANTQTLQRSVDGQRLIDAIDAVYDVANCTIAGVYSGHTHRDYYELSSKGYALISTSTDCENEAHSKADINSPIRTPGTTTEQTFDVVFINTTTHKFETIRIGAGANKTLEYKAKTSQELSGTQIDITSKFFNEDAEKRGWYEGAIQWQTGEFDNTSGTNARDWLSSDYIDVSEYDSITFNHVQVKNSATTNGYAFYNENKEYIIGYTNASGIDAGRIQEVTVKVPEDAKYVRIMWMSEDHGSYNDATYNIENFYCYGNKLAENVISLTSQFNDWTPGAILYATGLFEETATDVVDDWEYSNLVDISDYEKIAFSHIQVGNTATPNGFAFYGEDGTTLISGHTNGTGNAGIVRVEMDVPEGAKYIRIMWMKPGHSKYTEETYGKANMYFYGILPTDTAQE